MVHNLLIDRGWRYIYMWLFFIYISQINSWYRHISFTLLYRLFSLTNKSWNIDISDTLSRQRTQFKQPNWWNKLHQTYETKEAIVRRHMYVLFAQKCVMFPHNEEKKLVFFSMILRKIYISNYCTMSKWKTRIVCYMPNEFLLPRRAKSKEMYWISIVAFSFNRDAVQVYNA